MQQRWLPGEEIAAHLGVNRDTAYKWIGRKKLPAHHVGQAGKFPAPEADAWTKAGEAAGDAKRTMKRRPTWRLAPPRYQPTRPTQTSTTNRM